MEQTPIRVPVHPALAAVAPWTLLSDPQLSATSLKFADHLLERAYTSTTVRSSYLPLDVAICFNKLWISLVLVACIAIGALDATPVGQAVWVVYISMLSAHLCLMKLAPEVYIRSRGVTIIPIKLCLAATLTAFVPTFVLKPALSTAAYIQVLLLGAGLVMQLCTGERVRAGGFHPTPVLTSFSPCLITCMRCKALMFMYGCPAMLMMQQVLFVQAGASA